MSSGSSCFAGFTGGAASGSFTRLKIKI